MQSAVWQELAGGLSSAHDLCVAAPTGSGKTLAYALPVINALARWVPCTAWQAAAGGASLAPFGMHPAASRQLALSLKAGSEACRLHQMAPDYNDNQISTEDASHKQIFQGHF